MLNNITLGQYFPGDSFIHRLDPRTKILLTIMFLVCVFLSRGFLGFGLIVAFIFLVETPTFITVTYSVIMLVFIVLLSYEGWQRLKEIEEGLEDAVDNY